MVDEFIGPDGDVAYTYNWLDSTDVLGIEDAAGSSDENDPS